MKPGIVVVAAILLASSAPVVAQTPIRPSDQPRSVTLSLAEYNRLLDLANRAPGAAPAAPVPAVVSNVDLRLTVDRETVRGIFTLAGNVLQPGLTRVPLVSGTGVTSATAGGRLVPLVSERDTLFTVLPGPGPFSLALDWAAPLQFRPGRASFTVQIPQAGSAHTTIDLPGEQAEVRLSSGVITRRSAANGRTVVEATLDPGSPTEVSWSMRDSAPVQAARDLRLLAEVMTLMTLNDTDVRMVALVDVTVAQGELRTLTVRLPPGYELTSVSGNSLESSSAQTGVLILTVASAAARSHQFLINLERPHPGGSFDLESGLVSIQDAQRERGEVAIEGVGTMDLSAAEPTGAHRIDVRELHRSLHALSRLPILSAFRYQRPVTNAAPTLTIGVKRFDDAGVLAAVADHAVVTTMVTSEGRAITEVLLQVQNRSQPYLRVNLPQGATIVSVELAGEPAKPARSAGGLHVPLMRPGLRPVAPYQVSFVYLHAGTPFTRKGDIQMALPVMDIPIGVLHWEVFVPERYAARAIGGNVLDRGAFDRGMYLRRPAPAYVPASAPAVPHGSGPPRITGAADAASGQIRGRVVDAHKAPLPGASIEFVVGAHRQSVISDGNGDFLIAGAPQGSARLTASLAGFLNESVEFESSGRPLQVEFELEVGHVVETVTVTAAAGQAAMREDRSKMTAPSQNVINLQMRAQGVLPIRVDVPKAGASHQFVRPLVIDDETTVTLRYKSR